MSLPSYIVNWEELNLDLGDIFEGQAIRSLRDIKGKQRIKGYAESLPALEGTFKIAEKVVEEDKGIVLTGVTFSQSAWKGEDYWSLWVDDDKLFDTVYTKEIGDQKHWELIHEVKEGSVIKVLLHNVSGNSRNCWVDIEWVELLEPIGGSCPELPPIEPEIPPEPEPPVVDPKPPIIEPKPWGDGDKLVGFNYCVTIGNTSLTTMEHYKECGNMSPRDFGVSKEVEIARFRISIKVEKHTEEITMSDSQTKQIDGIRIQYLTRESLHTNPYLFDASYIYSYELIFMKEDGSTYTKSDEHTEGLYRWDYSWEGRPASIFVPVDNIQNFDGTEL